ATSPFFERLSLRRSRQSLGQAARQGRASTRNPSPLGARSPPREPRATRGPAAAGAAAGPAGAGPEGRRGGPGGAPGAGGGAGAPGPVDGAARRDPVVRAERAERPARAGPPTPDPRRRLGWAVPVEPAVRLASVARAGRASETRAPTARCRTVGRKTATPL